MSEHRARIAWKMSDGDFRRGKYSREHTWTFDGGLVVPASSSPSVVPVPYANPANIDPEEALIASLSSCHMLTFLDLARRDGVEVAQYDDDAVGSMSKNEHGVYWLSNVELRPAVQYVAGKAPSVEQEERLHHRAHEGCFIANSVKTNVVVKPVQVGAAP
ncbi:MAG TPA: OsmC family protein [Polyangiaceae bacterium]|jgi:organic hydroperoxide reductase OsmC/OhrA|nr:OsmC family protein [Polyangiaceae bacterium]